MRMRRKEFERQVLSAYQQLPESALATLDEGNIDIVVEDRPGPEAEGAMSDVHDAHHAHSTVLGLYVGVPLVERYDGQPRFPIASTYTVAPSWRFAILTTQWWRRFASRCSTKLGITSASQSKIWNDSVTAELPGGSWSDRLAWFIGSGCGSGLSPLAPGSAGSLVAAALLYAMSFAIPSGWGAWPGMLGIGLLSVGGLAVGVWATGRMSTPNNPDPGSATWDEFVGMWLTCLFIPWGSPFGWPSPSWCFARWTF